LHLKSMRETPVPVSVFRPEFEQALRLFASVSEAVEQCGVPPPVLVGGAAVELYTGSAVATGDFDLVTASQDILEAALRDHGFVKPSGPGALMRGWIHPDLGLGFEIVGSELLDGRAERDKVRLIAVDEARRFAVISVEDLIADRMGQFASGTAPEFLQQARSLFNLYRDADLAYMDRRIREETDGSYGIQDLEDRP
jgi:hypothetical protein